MRTEILDVGDSILLYTDGLIERPGRPLGASTAEFADLAANIASGASGFIIDSPTRFIDRICSETLELLLRSTGYNDDVTLLAAQRRTPPPPLHMTLDATVHAARTVRARLREWLAEIGADAADISDVVHAMSEFVENAVEHGYSTEVSDGVVVEASLGGDGNLRASVIDRGQWKDYREGEQGRGRGLAMAEALVSHAHVTAGPDGTTATLDATPFATRKLRHRHSGQPLNLPTGNRLRIRLAGRGENWPAASSSAVMSIPPPHPPWTARSPSKAVPA